MLINLENLLMLNSIPLRDSDLMDVMHSFQEWKLRWILSKLMVDRKQSVECHIEEDLTSWLMFWESLLKSFLLSSKVWLQLIWRMKSTTLILVMWNIIWVLTILKLTQTEKISLLRFLLTHLIWNVLIQLSWEESELKTINLTHMVEYRIEIRL